MRSTFATFALIIGSLTFAACRGPAELGEEWGTTTDNPFTNAQLDNTACGRNDGPDSDNDGLSDECEISLGYDPYNEDTDGDGIKDKFDTPPPTPTPTGTVTPNPEEAAWWQSVMGILGPSLIVGTSSLTKEAPPGTSVSLNKQVIIISDGTPNYTLDNGDPEGTPDPDAIAEWNVISGRCGAEKFVYFYVSGTVQLQCINSYATCDNPVLPAELELCATNDNWTGSDPKTIAGPYMINNMNWDKGFANGNEFDTLVLKRGDAKPKLDLTVSVHAEGTQNGYQYVKKIKLLWASEWTVKGVSQIPTTAGQYSLEAYTEVDEVENRWIRIDRDKYEVLPPKGIMGVWGNS